MRLLIVPSTQPEPRADRKRNLDRDLLPLIVSMLVSALFPFLLAVMAIGCGPITLGLISRCTISPFEIRHTLILLSLQGTQAVVTCLRGAFLGRSDSCCMVSPAIEAQAILASSLQMRVYREDIQDFLANPYHAQDSLSTCSIIILPWCEERKFDASFEGGPGKTLTHHTIRLCQFNFNPTAAQVDYVD